MDALQTTATLRIEGGKVIFTNFRGRVWEIPLHRTNLHLEQALSIITGILDQSCRDTIILSGLGDMVAHVEPAPAKVEEPKAEPRTTTVAGEDRAEWEEMREKLKPKGA